MVIFHEKIPQRCDNDVIATLNARAALLLARFKKDRRQSDLDGAFTSYKQALELCHLSHPLRPQALNCLANVLKTQYDQKGQQNDLDESISLHRQALELRQQNDLDESISLHRQALELRPPHIQASSLNNLANALKTRYNQGGQQDDLEESISLHRRALELHPPPHPDRASSLTNLASALNTRGQKNDIDESIFLHRQALDLCPRFHPARAHSLTNLATSLSARYDQGGQQKDLDESILLHRQALGLRPSPHSDRASSLNDLAIALQAQYEQRGQLNDLDETIFLHREALELRPPHMQAISLNNLASALKRRYGESGQQNDLDESIALNRQALELRPPSHPDRVSSLNNLALALQARYGQKGQQNDLDESISLHRQALELLPPTHSIRAISLYNLAKVLKTQYHQGGQQNDLDECISLHRQVLELHSPSHSHRSSFLNGLAIALRARYSQGGQQNDLDESILLHRQALELCLHLILIELALSMSASHRFKVAKTWIHYADVAYQHQSAIKAYDAALQALPQLAALTLDIQSRQKALTTGSDGLARDASKCAINTGNIAKAIEFLESGRTVFWSQLLLLCSPFDELRNIAPGLADQLQHISIALELGSYCDISVELLDIEMKLVQDQETARLNRLHEQWSKAIDSVRSLEGFKHFLQPPQFSALQAAASEVPVVMLVANSSDSNILIMTATNVHHISLPTLPDNELHKLVQLIQVATSHSKTRDCSVDISPNDISPTTLQNWINMQEKRGGRKFKDKFSSDDIFKSVLKTLWIDVIKPVITLLGLKKSEKPSALQWCPTGLFSFLSIHAAGCYDNGPSNECASDYIVSSYTPTISALLASDPTPSTKPFKMMVVIQSKELPFTQKELKEIEQHVPNKSLVRLGIPGSPAFVETVAACLSDVSIAHFACHGKQNLSEPLESGLKLEDGFLFVSRIMKERMPNGSLAFLCACDTAMGDEKLPDEAMSLAASILFSGFRHVIATMWKMMDGDGPIIADAFYEEIFRGPDGKPAPQPDTSKSAQALHIAIMKLGSNNVPFHRWVPFIHMGKCN
ncbi:hypothetical protein M413DRAFT_420131 [Hebeloma cylindrosporum]|uniref:CHAT domain-containing protein n=1 Tax=Hebeloma cylindrosporum TaxID=76867 RepID=A0A0C3C3A0_HEBCY|nr:hypothetical protein M413DRAFT_420131 [Hebeloma cylindrosporum h7]